MTSFGELLQLAGTSDPAELFGRAWRLWGSVQRSIEPAAAEGELRSAQALMSILVDAGALSERQLSQAELCRSSVSALLATLESPGAARAGAQPVAAAAAESETPSTDLGAAHAAPHAGRRHAPRPDALPAPSMLLGSGLLAARPSRGLAAGGGGGGVAAAARPTLTTAAARECAGGAGGEVGVTARSPPTARPNPFPSGGASAGPPSPPPPEAAPPPPAPAPVAEPPPPPPSAAAQLLEELRDAVEREAPPHRPMPASPRGRVGAL